jgi:hypothetical protein
VVHPDSSLTISAGPNPVVVISAAGTPAAPSRSADPTIRIGFVGPDGTWEIRLRDTKQRASRTTLPLTETSEKQIRDLLGGGTLTFTRARARKLDLTVPDAGISGRDWFGCVAQLHPGLAAVGPLPGRLPASGEASAGQPS